MTRGTSRSTTKTTFIEDHRWLLRLFGARSLTPVLTVAAALAAFMAWLGRAADTGTTATAALIAAGAIYWTFIEYAMHRWFYHWTPRRPGLRRVVESFHVYHHLHMDDREVLNAGPALSLSLTVILGAPVLALLRDVHLAALLMLGTVLAYALYEWVHHQCHRGSFRRGPLAYLQAFHLHHHAHHWRRNFGVTNPLWDLLFGTAVSPPRAAIASAPGRR
jgi:sterol desaturase/sphingolipid hydroxylase (fatty acid hydroxylase superfamily)